MRRAVLIALAAFVVACGSHNPPNPNPTPPPPTPPPTSTAPMLRLTPQLALVDLAGKPVKLRGCVAYSVPGHDEINSGWPGAFPAMVDFFAQYGCRSFEHRLGPFIANCAGEDDSCGESLWFKAGIGGSYNPDGSISEKFGNAVEANVAYIDGKGFNQGIIITDTWGCKVSDQGNPYNPWITLAPESLHNCAVQGDAVQETWVRYWVKRLTKYPGVYWQIDNEGDLVPHANQAWWNWMVAVIRDEEKKNGPNVHLTVCTRAFGGVCDFLYTHELGPASPIDGKFGLKNEYNPDHYNPGEVVSNISAADSAPTGVAYSYWQNDSTDEQALATLQGMKAAFDGHPVGCYAPDGNDPLWQGIGGTPTGPDSMAAPYNAARAAVGDRCGATGQCTPAREPCAPPTFLGCIDTSEMIAAELRKAGYCASGAWGGGPEIALLAPDGLWHQYHPCFTETGCYTGTPWKATWKYRGVNPTPPSPPPPASSSCSPPQPPALARFAMKESNKGPNWTTCDSTPLVHDAAYCAAAGFNPGTVDCPTRPEGSTERRACEDLIVGVPQWTGPGQVTSNPYVYQVRRGVQGTATVCGTVNGVCSSLQVTP